MWRLALLAVPPALLLALGAGILYSQSSTPSNATEPSATPTPVEEVLTPTSQPPAIFPTAAPAPPYPGTLKAGDWVRINTGDGDCLNARATPSLAAPPADAGPSSLIINCLADGFVGLLMSQGWGGNSADPIFADSHWWWWMAGQGYVVEDWLVFDHSGGFPWPQRPELAKAGLIAYFGPDGNLWMMTGDGSEQGVVVKGESGNEYFSSLSWSPKGDRLSFTVENWKLEGGSAYTATRIIDLSGSLLAELSGIKDARWSPDGTRMGALRVEGEVEGGLSSIYIVSPVVIDLATGVETVVGPAASYGSAPAWSPDGGALALICISISQFVSAQPGQPPQEELLSECGGDGLRTVSPDGAYSEVVLPMGNDGDVYYGAPLWRPDGKAISLSSGANGSGCRGYTVFNLESRTLGACYSLPPYGGYGGRCGGGITDGTSAWSPDGRYLLFHAGLGAGENGVRVVDVTKGTTTLIPNSDPTYLSLSWDGRYLAYSGAGYVWAADIDGANITLLAQGSNPAWQPKQS